MYSCLYDVFMSVGLRRVGFMYSSVNLAIKNGYFIGLEYATLYILVVWLRPHNHVAPKVNSGQDFRNC